MFDYHKALDQYGKDAALRMQDMDQNHRAVVTRMSNEARELRSRVKELELQVASLEAELTEAHGSTGLPASIQEALNSGDGTYRP